MKLHPVDRQLAMTQAHDLLFCRLGGDLEAIGQRLAFYNQRMVARRFEGIRQPREHPFAVVLDRRGLSMHEPRCADDVAPKHLPDALVAEADAEQRRFFAEPAVTSLLMPASVRVQGPGEITMRSGFIAAISSSVISSLRFTTSSAPSSPKYWTRLYVKES